MKKVLLHSMIVLMSLGVMAQDIHFSQFAFSPLYTSPGLTGMFNGTYRFVANYRNQWPTIPVPYNTIAVSAEMKIFELKNHDDVTAGLLLFRDVAGDSKMSNNNVGISLSYSKSLNYDGTHFLALGVQPSYASRSIKFDQLRFDNQFNGDIFDPSIPINETTPTSNKSYFDLGAGLSYQYRPDDRTHMTIGFNYSHILKPKQSFFNAPDVVLSPRMAIVFESNFKMGSGFDLSPQVFYQGQDGKKEIVFGTLSRFYVSQTNDKTVSINPGVMYRMNDAVIAVIGMGYNNTLAHFSYDINTSDLTAASGSIGAFELSLIHRIFTVGNIEFPGAICPVF